MRAAACRLRRDERGSVLLLGIGMIVVGILAVAIAADVSAAFLQRRALMSVGDSAALAGAQSIDLDSYYANGASIGTRLTPAAVALAARRHVGLARGSSEIAIEAITTDGVTVRVRLSEPLRLPFFGSLRSDRVRIESSARLDYRTAP
ncbi:MAG: hypothetical protein F2836_04640 [Actinobacteria bacterium]|uniref:Unannotated protein n=1 Tax=freshwater metagenome TaxID=449393 RepID=A0A6J7IY80_9ZZZZ|nr:hypothetical protein [Actinomycetota bacterium]